MIPSDNLNPLQKNWRTNLMGKWTQDESHKEECFEKGKNQ